jgi:glutamate dehydrogenase/leucine dehydrogenase
MDIRTIDAPDHEDVVACYDDATGLRSIIAIHNTKLGPGLGGTRFYPFASEEEALADVLRLSQAMTYKSAAAGLDFGGGKAVIIGDPRTEKNEDLLRAYARFVDSREGRYVTTEDVGTSVADIDVIATETKHVTGTSSGSGDPSDATAWGVFSGMRTIAGRLWGAATLSGRHVAIQGVGKVGSGIAEHLAAEGARLTVADIFEEAALRIATKYDADVVPTQEIHTVDCDILSPCALSGEINAQTVPEMRCAAIVGCANNQLATPEMADLVAQRGIIYAPDFIVNAGGVINIAYEVGRPYDRDAAFDHAWRIGGTLARVLDVAHEQGITTEAAAEHIAEQRLAR